MAVAVALVGGWASRVGAADGLAFVQLVRDGVREVDGLNGIQALALTPDPAGRFVYAAGANENEVAIFARDAATGRLSYVTRVKDGENGVDGIDGVRALAFTADGAFLYTAANRDDAVAAFRRNPETGLLSYIERKRDNVDGVDGLNGAEAVVVSPDDVHVYAVGRGDRAVAIFSRDAASGALNYLGMVQDGVGGVNGLRGTRGIAFSPDGQHVYVTGNDDNDIVIFQRDATTGALAFLGRQKDDEAGVDGLEGAAGMALSPDGTSLYAGGDDDDAIAVFHRDGTTGLLTFLEVHRDGAAGVEGLDGAEALAVSPDGGFVYAGGSDEQTIATFRRDPATGRLTFVAAQRNGIGDVDGLAGVGSVAVSADGLFVYAGGTDDDAVAVFSTRCGDGFVDPGEQCDDGNAAPADACSPGCRLPCATADDCLDPETCTEERCQQGECSRRRCAVTGGICQVDDTRAALLAETACAPIHPRLQRAITKRLKQAARLLRRTSLQRDPDLRILVKNVAVLVDRVDRKAAVLLLRHRITTACRAAIADATAALDEDVSDMVLHRGICAP